jgi:hypothetical protein
VEGDGDRINRDAREIQQDREDAARDTGRLLRDAVQGRSIDRDLDRLREDRQNTQEDRRRFKRDVDERLGDPGDVDAFARGKIAPVHPHAVTKERPQGQKKH